MEAPHSSAQTHIQATTRITTATYVDRPCLNFDGYGPNSVALFFPDHAKLAELRDLITLYLDAGANTPVAAEPVEW